jgi:hypothetical protein
MTTRPPIQHLLDEYGQAKASGHDRVLAETAYALAVRTGDDGQFEKAQEYAREALAAAERLPSNTLDDVASIRQEVAGNDTTMTLEIEYRAQLTEAQFATLAGHLGQRGDDLGQDDKHIWFYVLPDKPLKVVHNISHDSRRDEAGGSSQFPAGIVKPGGDPAAVAVVETLDKTGVHCRVTKHLGRRRRQRVRRQLTPRHTAHATGLAAGRAGEVRLP